MCSCLKSSRSPPKPFQLLPILRPLPPIGDPPFTDAEELKQEELESAQHSEVRTTTSGVGPAEPIRIPLKAPSNWKGPPPSP